MAKEKSLNMAILNLNGSDALDKVDACQALHDIDPGLKVVISNGGLAEPEMEKFKEHGFVNYLPKPYTLDDLKRVTSILW